MIKEMLEAFSNRIKSPLFGYTLIAFLLVNWKALLLLLLSDSGIEVRISAFESKTSFMSLFFYPFLIGALTAIFYPWINLTFLYLAKKPTGYRNLLQAESEHSLLVIKNNLEKLREQELEQKEVKLINRAKRDDELEKIENESLRERLEREIKSLRSERDALSSTNKEVKFNREHLKEQYDLYERQAEQAKKTGNPVQLKKAHDEMYRLDQLLKSTTEHA